MVESELRGAKVISLGWGVQSFGLAAMSALGVLPKVDAAIHADTRHERQETYRFAEKWTPWLEEHGIKVVTVQSRQTEPISKVNNPGIKIPAHTTTLDGQPSGSLSGRCTFEWEILPINRWILKNLGSNTEVWLGITLDEVERVKASRDKRLINRFPYLEMLDRPWRRSDVITWLINNGLEVPAKSGCYFCPFHGLSTWREIKKNKADWSKAVELDRQIRHFLPDFVCYLSSSRIPLEEVDLKTPEDYGQLTLFSECSES